MTNQQWSFGLIRGSRVARFISYLGILYVIIVSTTVTFRDLHRVLTWCLLILRNTQH